MRVLITAVGQRTEHWIDLFALLCEQPGLALTIRAADVSPQTDEALRALAWRQPNLRYQLAPHLLGENRTGHMASVLFRPTDPHRLTTGRPDLVHVIGEAAYLSTWQVLRRRQRHWPDVPVTLYAAQNIVMRFPPPFPLLERYAYHTVTHAFPITPAALRVLRAKGYRGPATIVPLGVDTRLFTPSAAPRPARPFTVGFVGRLEPHKGVTDLLRAVESLGCGLLAVGRGSLAAQIGQAAARAPHRVRLHDWVDHAALPDLLRRMDVLVLPSIEVIQRNVLPWIGIPLREQFGRVLVEAMACGVPVVGSEVGEIPHIVGTAGLTYPPGDVAALTERLARLRDERTLANDLRERGLRRADEFSWHRAATTMCDTWRALLGDRRHASHPRPSYPAVVGATSHLAGEAKAQ